MGSQTITYSLIYPLEHNLVYSLVADVGKTTIKTIKEEILMVLGVEGASIPGFSILEDQTRTT